MKNFECMHNVLNEPVFVKKFNTKNDLNNFKMAAELIKTCMQHFRYFAGHFTLQTSNK
jgi:hypothetical protein